jgi:hypothetical protein
MGSCSGNRCKVPRSVQLGVCNWLRNQTISE